MFEETTRRVAIPLRANSDAVRNEPYGGKERAESKGFSQIVIPSARLARLRRIRVLYNYPLHATWAFFHEVVQGIRVTDRCAS